MVHTRELHTHGAPPSRPDATSSDVVCFGVAVKRPSGFRTVNSSRAVAVLSMPVSTLRRGEPCSEGISGCVTAIKHVFLTVNSPQKSAKFFKGESKVMLLCVVNIEG